jgi:hypothetical protein
MDIKKINLKNELKFFEEYELIKDQNELIIELKNDILKQI